MIRFHSTAAGLRAAACALVLIAATSACGDDPTDVEEEPNVATMRITIGSQTINVNAATGAVTGGPVVIPTGNTNVSVQFLLANGQPDPVVTATGFRADVTPTNTALVTFTRTSAFAGTLTRVAAGTTTLNVSLFHLGEGHDEFKWPVSVTVQ